MKLFQLTIPDDRLGQFFELLEDQMGLGDSLLQMRAASAFTVLQFRVDDDHVTFVLAELQRMGLGVSFGFCDVLDLKASTVMPSRTLSNHSIFESSVRKSTILPPSQIYTNIAKKTTLTTDTAIIAIMSSVMAGIGLAINNRLYIMAGSLLSRTMGSLMGISYGLAVLDRDLFTSGVKNFALHLLLIVSVGALLGAAFSPFAPALLWPTDEMAKRGVYVEILFGGLIAICGGAAVAVSESNEDMSGISGIAISSALVPPAVNVGLCVSFLFVGPLAVPGYDIDSDLFISIAVSSLANVVINSFFIYATAFVVFRLRGGNMKFKFMLRKQSATGPLRKQQGRGRTLFSPKGNSEDVVRSRAKSR